MTEGQEVASTAQSGSTAIPGASASARRRRVVALIAIAWPAIVLAAYFIPRVSASGPWVDGLVGWTGWPRYVVPAMARTAHALIAALWLSASAATVGWLVARRFGWRVESLTERLVHPLIFGIGVLAMAGLGSAALGVYRPATLVVLSAVPLLTWLAPATRPQPFAGWDRRELAAARADAPWLVTLGAATAVALIVALAPPTAYDELWYHLYFPRLALDQGHLVDLPDEYVSLYPMLWGVWYGYGLTLGGAVGAKLLHALCLPLALLVVHDLTRRYTAGANPWVGAAVFAAMPIVVWLAGTAYNDLALALLTVAALHALLRYAEEPRASWLVAASASLGIALASKLVTALIMAVVCLWLVALLWRRDRSVRHALGPAVAVGGAALLIALPWYVRAWWMGGNPVLPELYGVFGADPERWNEASARGLAGYMAQFGRAPSLPNLLTLPWHATMRPERYAGAFGPVLLALLPLVLLRRSSWQLRALTAFAFSYLILWASPLASFQLRWLMPAAPIFAVLAAAGLHRAQDTLQRFGWHAAARVTAALILVTMLLQLPPFGALHRRHAPGPDGRVAHTVYDLPIPVFTGMMSRDEYLDHVVGTHAVWRAADTLLPLDALVLVYWGGDHFYSTRRRMPAMSIRGSRVALAPPDSLEAALAAAERLGITHVLWDDRFLRRYGFTQLEPQDLALMRDENRSRWLELLFDRYNTRLYRLRSRSEAGSS